MRARSPASSGVAGGCPLPRKPFDPSGIRLGTPALTTRGLTEAHMPQVAAWIDEAIDATRKEDEATLDRIAAEVRDLLADYPIP